MGYYLSSTLETISLLALLGFATWVYYRHKTRAGERETEVMMRALEKSDSAEEVLRNMQKPRKSVRQRLLNRLTWGWCLSIAGFLLTVLPFVYGVLITTGDTNIPYDWDDVLSEVGPFCFVGGVLLGVGIGFLISYFVGKHTLKEDD